MSDHHNRMFNVVGIEAISFLITVPLLIISIISILVFENQIENSELMVYISSGIAILISTLFLFCLPHIVRKGGQDKYIYTLLICGILLSMIPCIMLASTSPFDPDKVKTGGLISSSIGLVAGVIAICVCFMVPPKKSDHEGIL